MIDPRTDLPRYVGYTTKSLEDRLYKHIMDSKGKNIHRAKWLKSLQDRGLKPIINLIEEVPDSEWQFWERYWISQYRTWGFDLTNLTDGGLSYSVKLHDPDVQRRAGMGKLGWKHSLEHIEKRIAPLRGKKRSKEIGRKISIALIGKFKGIPKSEDHKRKISESNKGKIVSEETRLRLQKVNIGRVSRNRISVVGINRENGVKKIYDCIAHVANDGFVPTCITRCLNGELKQHKGFIWNRV